MHRSFLIFAAAFVALLAGALFYAARFPVEQAAAPQAEPVVTDGGADAPHYLSFTLKDIDGEERDFSDWHGRPRLLNFWATWCAPCRREIPVLKAFQAEQPDDGILVMGIAVDVAADVAVFAEAVEFNYPILVGERDAMAVAESSGIDFVAMPFTMIVARDGEYLGAYLGELHRDQLDDIANVLNRLDAGEISTAEAAGAFELL
ncbi:MAG: TlpA disulfide reductase family protein [Woeseiaceae bacterium]|nr:TlpA disulfide reductase family protein [Woeseiaceae bacterium]